MPDDLKLPEGKQVFTIMVKFETSVLYGEIQASRRIVIAAER